MAIEESATTVTGGAVPDEGGSRLTGVAAHATAWAFAFLLLRIFAVSGYDWDTAFAVSTTLGLGDGLALLFGSLMAGQLLVAILLVLVLPLLIAAYVWGPRSHRPVVLLSATVGTVTLLALSVSFAGWWLSVGTAAVFGVLALIRLLPPQHRLRRATSAVMVRASLVTGVGVLVVASLTQTPWVPREDITTTHGVITGYVLSVDSGFLNVLTEEHEFVIVISGDVLRRD